MYSEVIQRLRQLQERVRALKETLDFDATSRKLAELEGRMAHPDFWANNEKAQEVIVQIKKLKREVEPAAQIERSAGDLLDLARMAQDEQDPSALKEIEQEAQRLEAGLERVELSTILGGPNDASNAFLSVHAGAGGTESCDWASMLARMYTRFCERQGFTATLVDVVDGEEAGIRNVTYLVKGSYAFGYLQSETGVHRLVRISPFDAKSRRHTSFAAVDVIPELPETDKAIEINPSDVRVDTFRAGGAGGQHVNKTDSAVRMTHLPTGIVVQCQNERSQHSNRAMALKLLKAKLLREEEKKRDAELAKLYGQKGEIAFGFQIRSYTLQPFTLVKDHRTDLEIGNAGAVLDGDILPLIEAYLRSRRKKG